MNLLSIGVYQKVFEICYDTKMPWETVNDKPRLKIWKIKVIDFVSNETEFAFSRQEINQCLSEDGR